MNFDEKSQQNLINLLISDKTIFTRARTILQPRYFSSQFQKTISYLLDFSQKYNSLPLIDQINDIARLDEPLKIIDGVEQNTNIHKSILDTVEKFCQQRALELAVIECADKVNKGQGQGIDVIVKEAQKVSLQKDFGINFWENPKEWLGALESEQGTVSTGWTSLDDLLNGGFCWGELEYFVAPANMGKSLAMQNIGLNWSRLGNVVLFFTLEMDMKLVGKRIAAMATRKPYRTIKFNIDEIAEAIVYERMNKKPGVFQLINIKQGCTALDIEAYIQDFELKTNLIPNIIIVDYADIMTPCDKRYDPNNIGLIDNKISLELRELVRERTKNGKPSLCLTASQITKDAMAEEELNLSNVAGGKAKSCNADNMIAVSTSDAMRAKGEYRFTMLKTRNSGGKGKKLKIKYDVDTLRMEDMEIDLDSDTSLPNGQITNQTALSAIDLLKSKITE